MKHFLLFIVGSGNGLDHEQSLRCFLFGQVQLMRELKPKQTLSRQKEGACGEHNTPLLFPPSCPAGVTERVG